MAEVCWVTVSPKKATDQWQSHRWLREASCLGGRGHLMRSLTALSLLGGAAQPRAPSTASGLQSTAWSTRGPKAGGL